MGRHTGFRQLPFNRIPGTITPEAPRTIFDALSTLDALPMGLHARAEYEYVGGTRSTLNNMRRFRWTKLGLPWCVPSWMGDWS